MNEAFEKILERLDKDCWLTTNDDGETNELSIRVVSLEDANKIVQEVAVEYAPDTNVVSNGWIMCDVKMPEERDSIFAQFKGTDKWKNSMFERMSEFVNATVEFEDGTRMVKTLHTVDGKWHMGSGFLKYKVIAWQPLPAPFREIEVSE